MTRITLQEFEQLPDYEQYEIILHKGELAIVKLSKNRRIELYSVDKFFVEIQVNKIDESIKSKRAFNTGNLLDKYAAHSVFSLLNF